MLNIDDYKEKRLNELKDRLNEIDNMIGIDITGELTSRDDSFGMRLKENKIAAMKKHFNEMVEIKREIAKIEGRESIFDEIGE